MRFLKKRSRNGHASGIKQEELALELEPLELYDEKERKKKMGSSRKEEMNPIGKKYSAMKNIQTKLRVKNIYFLLWCSVVTFVLLQIMVLSVDKSTEVDMVNFIELDSEPNEVSAVRKSQ